MSKISKWMTVGYVLLPLLALGQGFGTAIGPAEAAPVSSFEDVLGRLNVFIGWFQALLFIVAVIFILYAAFLFLTSAGDPGKVDTARKIILWAAVGIGVALLAFSVSPIVRQLLGSAPPRF